MRSILQILLAVLTATLLLSSCEDSNLREQEPVALRKALVNEVSQNKKGNNKQNTYVLVHGAWHPSSVWDETKQALESKGNTVIAVQLPGLGNDSTSVSSITLQSHVSTVEDVVMQITDSVILVGHSYGGVVISQVGENLPTKVKRLVYVSAFMLEDGETLADIALADTLSVATQNVYADSLTVNIPQDKLLDAFYNYSLENSNPHVDAKIQSLIPLLRPHPLATFITPVALTSVYNSLKKLYVACPDDQAITYPMQQFMYGRFPETEVKIIQNADHSPFISRPNQLINILEKL